MKELLHFIHVEDIAADSELIIHLLNENGFDCRVRRVETRHQLLNALDEPDYKLVLSDCTLPGYSGLEALRDVRQRKPNVPFIFVSGTIGEEVAIRSLQEGATDYVLKNRLSRLVPAVRRALNEAESRKIRHAMEEQLRQARELEAVGLLAGGLAHDVKNIFQILRLNLSLLPMKADEPAEVHKLAEQMDRTLDRGCEMMKELLSFARKSESRLLPADLTQDIRDTVNGILSSLPENVQLQLDLMDNLPQVMADVGQIDRIVANLIVNARDAMPSGGILHVCTGLTCADSQPHDSSPAKRTTYVRVGVSDTGVGMDEATRTRIFEPFFTTKAAGMGTGLGLAVVCGLMENHEGLIDVQSEEGKGTTISLYFPVITSAPEEADETLKRESRDLLGLDDTPNKAMGVTNCPDQLALEAAQLRSETLARTV
jgi:two-component system cell cycle sensor histidine kinase/response regulator CckA